MGDHAQMADADLIKMSSNLIWSEPRIIRKPAF